MIFVMMKTTRRVVNGTVEIAATMTMIIGICIAMIVYVLIQLLEAPPHHPLMNVKVLSG